MEIVHYQRRPIAHYFSVERIFEDVRRQLRDDGMQVRLRVNRWYSRGIFGRLGDAVAAAFVQGSVNHVTGDVHYLTYFLRRDRTVLTILDCVGLDRLTGLKRWLFKLLWYRIPVWRAREITVISEFTRDEVVRATGVAPGRIVVVPPPLSTEFRFKEHVFDAERPRILQVGTTPNKNISRLVDALRGIACRLVIVGQLDEQQLARLAASGVDFENHVGLDRNALLEEYERADVVAFVSTYEGFGMPVVEANAVGRVVVAGNVCSIPAVAGGAACLVDPFDPAAIRAGFRRVIDDGEYRAELIASGLRNAQRFRIEDVARQYADVYRRVGAPVHSA